jgi:hypothetical protein
MELLILWVVAFVAYAIVVGLYLIILGGIGDE